MEEDSENNSEMDDDGRFQTKIYRKKSAMQGGPMRRERDGSKKRAWPTGH